MRNGFEFPIHAAWSDVIEVANVNEPTQGHLALTGKNRSAQQLINSPYSFSMFACDDFSTCLTHMISCLCSCPACCAWGGTPARPSPDSTFTHTQGNIHHRSRVLCCTLYARERFVKSLHASKPAETDRDGVQHTQRTLLLHGCLESQASLHFICISIDSMQ